MIEIAKKYHSWGLSVIPIAADKHPRLANGNDYAWKKHTEKLVAPNQIFNDVYGIGIVCGKVSGYLQALDIDLKYDLTGKLYDELKKLINSENPNLLRKMVVEKTPSGGYHFIFKCKEIEGNQKLANRETTEEEKLKDPKQKIKVLLETRAEGGFIACYPTKGYEIIYGSFDKIQEITPEERNTLFDCSRAFNQVFDIVYEKKANKKIIEENLSPFEDWNNRGDVLELLEAEGWKVTKQHGYKSFLLRPGGTGKWSAEWQSDMRLFYVWTSSSEFDNEKAYNPSQVLATLKFNKDYSATAIWLLKNGYGEHQKKEYKKTDFITETKISLDDEDYSFLASNEEADIYIKQKREGTFKQGNTTGIPELDAYYRFKEAQLDMILGHDNAGKSVVSWYFSVLDCLYNKENYIVFSGENKTGAVKGKLMEFYLCKTILSMNLLEYEAAKKWVEDHFALVRNDEAYSYQDMITIGRKMLKKKKYTKFIIEPYNVLDKKTTNEHQYDYKAMLDLRLFIRQTGIGVLLNVHAATEALRKTYPKEHQYFGFTMPPNKADAEGGGKFPNKADNFIVVHRMADHESEWMWTEIHVQKIKEMETGGKRTFKNEPFKMRMVVGGVGFETATGFNPVLDYWNKQGKTTPIEFEKPTAMKNNLEFLGNGQEPPF